jgi:2-methylcitrate dehydratase PrpD
MTSATQARDVTGELIALAARTHLDQIPSHALTIGKQLLVNAIALAVASAGDDAPQRAFEVVDAMRTPQQATILGRGIRVGAGWAAFLNGIAVHAQDFDDTHLRSVFHAGASIVPAALAAAEFTNASGSALLEAVILSAEVATRIASGLSPQLYDRGWHVTSVIGHLAAAIAAARALGLDETQMRNALGITATEATGLSAANGTMTKSFHPGKAALDGVEAAILAREGFTAAAQAIEGRRGLAGTLVGTANYDAMLDLLGTRWEMTSIAFKPYACGVLAHGLIDAAIDLRKEVLPEKIARVEARVHPATLGHMGIADPKDGLESKFSARHCAAIGFVDGAAGPRQFSDARARAPEIVALRKRVTILPDPALAKGAASVRVETIDGHEFAKDIAHASGSVENPMSAAQIAAKANALAGEEIGPLLATLDRIEDVGSVNVLVAEIPVCASALASKVSD